MAEDEDRVVLDLKGSEYEYESESGCFTEQVVGIPWLEGIEDEDEVEFPDSTVS